MALGIAAVPIRCPRRFAASITSASNCAIGNRYTARFISSLNPKSSPPTSTHCDSVRSRDEFDAQWRRSTKATAMRLTEKTYGGKDGRHGRCGVAMCALAQIKGTKEGRGREEIGQGGGFLEEGEPRVVYLEPWQMKKMVAAASLGARCVNLGALAAEVGLDRSDVLAWLENAPSKIVILDAGEGSYMEDVLIEEEAEKPAVYVPAPPIPSREVKMRRQVEDLMYTLKDLVSGSPAGIVTDEERSDTALKLFSEEVEVQNPLFCLRGRDGLFEWLQLLGRLGVGVKLLDIYYESKANDPYKRWVHASWTATLTDDLQRSVVELGLADWWAGCQGGELVSSSGYDDKQHASGNQSWSKRTLQLSGEWRFEMDESGQVTDVHSRWYKLAEQGGDVAFTDAKLWLSGVLSRVLLPPLVPPPLRL